MATTETAKVARVTLSHRQTVQSKYLPDSGRIRVSASGGVSKYYNYDHELDGAEAHASAIEHFLNVMNWEGVWSIGLAVKQDGYVAVWTGHNEEGRS